MAAESTEAIWMIPDDDGESGDGASSSGPQERFDVRKRIGAGGMGVVYEANDRQKGELVAVKLLHTELLQEDEMINQFMSEASIATSLTHPNIVNVFDVHVIDGQHALVMELLEGRTLRDAIREKKAGGEAFSVSEVVRIIGMLCDALAYAHEFTVHRDIKPENVWICEDGTVKLMDFGLARLVRRTHGALPTATLTKLQIGSPYYMAPEQFQGKAQVDHRTDQFAVGVIVYEMLTGELPVGLAAPLEERRPDLARRLTRAVDRALSTDSSNRFSSIMEFKSELAQGATETPGWMQKLQSRPRLRRALAACVLAILGVATLAVGKGLWDRRLQTKVGMVELGMRDLADVRGEAAGFRGQVSDIRKRWIASQETAGPTATTAPSPDNKSPEAGFLEEARTAVANHEHRLISSVWEWLSPHVDETGNAYAIIRKIDEATQLLRDRNQHGFARQLADVRSEIVQKSSWLEESESVFQARILVDALLASQDAGAAGEARGRLGVAMEQLEAGAWDTGAAGILRLRDELRLPLEARYQDMLAARRSADENWGAKFPEDLGPPNLEFLGYPNAKAKAAAEWRTIGRFDRALPLLQESVDIIKSWTTELEDLHTRTDADFLALAPEQRMENALGMRFVSVGGKFWSIWETRVMDFARFVDQNGDGSQNAGEFWKNPGYPQGPTSPVVGVKRRVANSFTFWAREHSWGDANHALHHGLPTTAEWKMLFNAEPKWTDATHRIALWPDPDEFERLKWETEYGDPTVEPDKWVDRVGRGQRSEQGLYDLMGNAWEWSSNFYHPPTGKLLEMWAAPDERLELLYGGGSFGEISWHGLNPPEPGMCFIVRRDVAGFRMVLRVE